MTTTAFDIPDCTDSIASDEVIAIAFRSETASLAAREAWRAYCQYVDASPDGYTDDTTAALYAAHIAADDAAQTRCTTLMRALQQYAPRVDVLTLTGQYEGRAVRLEFNRVLHMARVYIAPKPVGLGAWPEAE